LLNPSGPCERLPWADAECEPSPAAANPTPAATAATDVSRTTRAIHLMGSLLVSGMAPVYQRA
jgi:hypothetical protein